MKEAGEVVVATEIKNAVVLQITLCEGEVWASMDSDGTYETFKALPLVVEIVGGFDAGRPMVKRSWNSDTRRVWYSQIRDGEIVGKQKAKR